MATWAPLCTRAFSFTESYPNKHEKIYWVLQLGPVELKRIVPDTNYEQVSSWGELWNLEKISAVPSWYFQVKLKSYETMLIFIFTAVIFWDFKVCSVMKVVYLQIIPFQFYRTFRKHPVSAAPCLTAKSVESFSCWPVDSIIQIPSME